MNTLRPKRISLLVLICLLTGAPGWAQVFGVPDMLDIRSISPDLVTFNGREGDVPAFTSVTSEFLFAPPIDLDAVEAAEDAVTFGTAQLGSGWCFPCDGATMRIHLGTDLALLYGNTEDAVNVYAMSDGEVVFNDPDSSGWGCHIVVRHELSPEEEYPFDVIAEWQDAGGNLLVVRDGELKTADGRLIEAAEPVFPRSSHMERFRPGLERPYRYLYIDYQHIVPLGSTRQACAIDPQVEKGDLLGTIDPAIIPVPHVHIHARYAESTAADGLEAELKAGTAVYKRQDIFRNGELVEDAITRYRVGALDYQGSLPVVNPLRLAYTPQLCSAQSPCIHKVRARPSITQLRIALEGERFSPGEVSVFLGRPDEFEELQVEGTPSVTSIAANLGLAALGQLSGRGAIEVWTEVNGTESNRIPIPFRDVPHHQWYAPYVLGSWRRDVISGLGDSGFFQPARNINFAEFFKMLVLASEIAVRPCIDGENPVPTFGPSFPPYNAAGGAPWFCSYYKTVIAEGWLAPFLALRLENEEIRGMPSDPVLRQEVAFFLARILPPLDIPADPLFPDVDADNRFRTEIGRIRVEGIVQGDREGRFNPTQQIIRAEIVKVLELMFHGNEYPEDRR
jgi:hypothetical protein